MSDQRTANFSQKGFTRNFLELMKRQETKRSCCSLSGPSILYVSSSDFNPDGITFLSKNLEGVEFSIFLNELNRYIYDSVEESTQIEWQYVPGGFQILLPGFDANTFSYHLYVSLKTTA